MFKKTQKYLLLNYPLLWNIKILPIGLTILGLNLLFFFFGYISGKIDFQDTSYYYYSSFRNMDLLYFIAGFTSVLTFIIWLIFYLKNNAFKSFYPKKSISLYYEWILIFILVSANALYCFSYNQGIVLRRQNQVSHKQFVKGVNILDKIRILIPKSETSYDETDVANPNNEHKDSVVASLLNYPESESFSFRSFFFADSTNLNTVRQWLIEDKKDSIKLLIQQYLDLQKKHNLETNLTADKWFDLIYHYPDFPINPQNHIEREKPVYEYSNKHVYYVQYNNLINGYQKINDNCIENSLSKTEQLLRTTLYISLFISIALFSFRVTSGKSWLISLVVAGLLIFIFGISVAFFDILFNYDDEFIIIMLVISFWYGLFIIMIIYLANLILNHLPKRKSPVILNLSIWLIPILPLILYYTKFVDKSIFRNYPNLFFWINLIFVNIIFFFLMKPIKKLRALPEE